MQTESGKRISIIFVQNFVSLKQINISGTHGLESNVWQLEVWQRHKNTKEEDCVHKLKGQRYFQENREIVWWWWSVLGEWMQLPERKEGRLFLWRRRGGGWPVCVSSSMSLIVVLRSIWRYCIIESAAHLWKTFLSYGHPRLFHVRVPEITPYIVKIKDTDKCREFSKHSRFDHLFCAHLTTAHFILPVSLWWFD